MDSWRGFCYLDLTMRTRAFALSALLLLCGAAPAPSGSGEGLPSKDDGASAAARPASWAQPITRPGLPNFFKVSDGLYRGAQPTAEGLDGLKEFGVKTVVDLRAAHFDSARMPAGLGLVRIRMLAWPAREEDMVRFLRVATDGKRGPVFVHCAQGADRTGLMVAVYRVAAQGWSKEEAIREMTAGGYGFHPVWKNIPAALRKLDLERLKAKAGLSGPPALQGTHE